MDMGRVIGVRFSARRYRTYPVDSVLTGTRSRRVVFDQGGVVALGVRRVSSHDRPSRWDLGGRRPHLLHYGMGHIPINQGIRIEVNSSSNRLAEVSPNRSYGRVFRAFKRLTKDSEGIASQFQKLKKEDSVYG